VSPRSSRRTPQDLPSNRQSKSRYQLDPAPSEIAQSHAVRPGARSPYDQNTDATGNGLPDPRPHGQNDRALALQRKNALFAGHDLGAENWAIIASLVETCKLNAIDPQAYLTDVLGRIIHRGDGDPVDDLLPYNWADSRTANLPSITAQAA
jgi:hypothetical protein